MARGSGQEKALEASQIFYGRRGKTRAATAEQALPLAEVRARAEKTRAESEELAKKAFVEALTRYSGVGLHEFGMMPEALAGLARFGNDPGLDPLAETIADGLRFPFLDRAARIDAVLEEFGGNSLGQERALDPVRESAKILAEQAIEALRDGDQEAPDAAVDAMAKKLDQAAEQAYAALVHKLHADPALALRAVLGSRALREWEQKLLRRRLHHDRQWSELFTLADWTHLIAVAAVASDTGQDKFKTGSMIHQAVKPELLKRLEQIKGAL